MTFSQAEFDIRCEWGLLGVSHLAPISDAIIIVDVMSFSTCVVIASGRGAAVYPHRWKYDSAKAFAESISAELAGSRSKLGYSLSPASVMAIPSGTRLVLPSPNGSTLSLAAGGTPTFAGCLRNCSVVAEAAMHCGRRVAVIPAGERWKDDDSLRPCLEDLLGAGAIIEHLAGALSPEAQAVRAAWRDSRGNLLDALKRCSSGKELIAMGYEHDVALIAEVDVDRVAPVLRDGAYVKFSQPFVRDRPQ